MLWSSPHTTGLWWKCMVAYGEICLIYEISFSSQNPGLLGKGPKKVTPYRKWDPSIVTPAGCMTRRARGIVNTGVIWESSFMAHQVRVQVRGHNSRSGWGSGSSAGRIAVSTGEKLLGFFFAFLEFFFWILFSFLNFTEALLNPSQPYLAISSALTRDYTWSSSSIVASWASISLIVSESL